MRCFGQSVQFLDMFLPFSPSEIYPGFGGPFCNKGVENEPLRRSKKKSNL